MHAIVSLNLGFHLKVDRDQSRRFASSCGNSWVFHLFRKIEDLELEEVRGKLITQSVKRQVEHPHTQIAKYCVEPVIAGHSKPPFIYPPMSLQSREREEQ